MLSRVVSKTVRGGHARTYSTKVRDVVIVSAVRTPIGSFGGSLASLTAPQLGSIAVKAAVERAGIKPSQVQEVYFGNVVSANIGQAPARQVTLGAGLENSTITTTVNKVCASGMKTVMLGASAIMLGQQDIIVAGGMESMSNAPYYVDARARFGGFKYGDMKLIDGLNRDGLSDAYNGSSMGLCGEHAAKTHGFTREQQDEFAIRSYKLGAESTAKGLFKSEIVPVEVPQKKGNPVVVSEDEEFKKANFDKIKQLKPAFDKNGSVTAANSSSLNDGASALVLMAAEKAQELGLKPIARIRGFADAETLPIDFPVAPALAIPKLLKQTGVNINDVDFWEINEAFAVVILANMKLLGIPVEKVNVRGGAIALGHPIGASGARIITSLAHLLQQTPSGKIGVAAICNGGGGASSIMIEKF